MGVIFDWLGLVRFHKSSLYDNCMAVLKVPLRCGYIHCVYNFVNPRLYFRMVGDYSYSFCIVFHAHRHSPVAFITALSLFLAGEE